VVTRDLLTWILYGLFAATGLAMVILGLLFFHSMVMSSPGGQGIFTLLLFGIILLVAGGGLLSSTIAESFRRLSRRS
jgi:hypothetical protein